MNNYCTFYLVRHGETEWNVKRIMQGHRDSQLSERTFGKYEGWSINKYYKKFEQYFIENQRLSEIETYKRKPVF